MPNIILQIQKQHHILLTKQFQNLKISKENIEKHVLELTGLVYEQYDVFYIDGEDDSIMTVVEDDYAIAQMTLESDTITFHIEVKVDEGKIKFSQEIHQSEDNKQESQCSWHSAAQQQKVGQVYQSAISSQNPQQLQRDIEEQLVKLQNCEKTLVQGSLQCSPPVQNQLLLQKANQIKDEQPNNQGPSSQIEKSDFENSQSLQVQQVSGQIQYKQQLNQHDQSTIPKNQGGPRQTSSQKCNELQKLLEKPELLELLFGKICQRLPNILKPECFIQKEQTKKDFYRLSRQVVCHICKHQIREIPYYINQQSQQICQDCEPNYQGNEILVKIRSLASKAELLAVKFISISQRQLSHEDQTKKDPKLRQQRIKELLLQKLSLQIRK